MCREKVELKVVEVVVKFDGGTLEMIARLLMGMLLIQRKICGMLSGRLLLSSELVLFGR
jgi:hypothetical protein